MSLLLAVIIVIILIIAFYGLASYAIEYKKLPRGLFKDTIESFKQGCSGAYDKYFAEPDKLYEKTIGYEFNDTAKLALNKALKKNEMYVRNEANGGGTRTPAKLRDATMAAFVAGDIYRYNVATNADDDDRALALYQTAILYNRALNIINENPVVIPNIPADIIIDRAEDFYEDHQFQPVVNFQVVRDDARRTIAGAVPQKEYFAPKPVYNDPQNVHDSAVTNAIRDRFDIIRKKNTEENQEFNDEYELGKMAEEINKLDDIDKRRRAQNTFEMLKNKKSIVTSLNTTEYGVLMEVWKRINSAENAENIASLKEAFVDSLINATEKNGGDYVPVCTQGRCNRLLDSLTVLDADKGVAEPPKTKDIFKNEIMSKTFEIVKRETDAAPEDIKKAYNGETTEISPELQKKLDEFTENLKRTADKEIRDQYPNGPQKILDDVIADAQAGI